jgi:hypothetical protein
MLEAVSTQYRSGTEAAETPRRLSSLRLIWSVYSRSRKRVRLNLSIRTLKKSSADLKKKPRRENGTEKRNLRETGPRPISGGEGGPVAVVRPSDHIVLNRLANN